MKRLGLAVLLLVVVAIPALAAPRTIYVQTAVHTRVQVERILRAEAPWLRIVSRAEEADLILHFSARAARANRVPAEPRSAPARLVASSSSGQHRAARPPGSIDDRGPQPMPAAVGSAAAYLRDTATGEERLIHAGLTSPFFKDQAARKVVELTHQP
jgi:hypothetical protein